MTVVHWQPSDPLGDVLRQAWRAGLAPPTAIHLRPELFTRLLTHMSTLQRAAALEQGTYGHPHTITLIIDNNLPPHPGFEIYRTPPGTERRSVA